jgi:hypothetical protein
MAFEQNPYAIKVTFVAGETLGGQGYEPSKQFHFIRLSDQLVGTTPVVYDIDNTVEDRPIGILQNQPRVYFNTTPNLRGEAEVTISGVTKVVAGGNIEAGYPVGAGTYGKAVQVTDTGDSFYIVGTALTSGVDGDVITVVINCAAPVPAPAA